MRSSSASNIQDGSNDIDCDSDNNHLLRHNFQTKGVPKPKSAFTKTCHALLPTSAFIKSSKTTLFTKPRNDNPGGAAGALSAGQY
jgi:hypothetical protein